MQLGNAAWGLRETPLEQQLAITAAMGLELLELSIAGYERDYLQLDADEKKIAEVAEHSMILSAFLPLVMSSSWRIPSSPKGMT